MTEVDLAWLAGIWDGEGSVFIAKQVQSKRVQYRATISMDNTDAGIISEAVRILNEIGIQVHVSESLKKGSTKTVYRIASSNTLYVQKFIEKVSPYLKGEKKAKASLVMKFVLSRLEKGKHPYTDNEVLMCESFRSSTTTREAHP